MNALNLFSLASDHGICRIMPFKVSIIKNLSKADYGKLVRHYPLLIY